MGGHNGMKRGDIMVGADTMVRKEGQWYGRTQWYETGEQNGTKPADTIVWAYTMKQYTICSILCSKSRSICSDVQPGDTCIC